MNVQELDYELPAELIAQHPPERRDASRLLVLDKARSENVHTEFRRLGDWLSPGDLLVVNDTRVVPARMAARRRTGGRVDGLFLRELAYGQWEVLLNGRGRLRTGESLELVGADRQIRLSESLGRGRWRVCVDPPADAETILARAGRTPLPPYIKRPGTLPPELAEQDRQRYQTVYAERPGSVAAPTAGLHFTEAMLAELRRRRIGLARLTLHIGLGTFQLIEADRLDEHAMHAEWFDLPARTAQAVNRTRQRGGRVIAVGTSSLRVLESCCDDSGRVRSASGWTDLFIRPPYRVRSVDGLLTNFHLPRSTLLALAFAVAGRERILEAYRQAIQMRYRFYSYGDAMLILSIRAA